MARPRSLGLDIAKRNYLSTLAKAHDVDAARAAGNLSKYKLRDLRRRDDAFKAEERRIASRYHIILDGRVKAKGATSVVKKKETKKKTTARCRPAPTVVPTVTPSIVPSPPIVAPVSDSPAVEVAPPCAASLPLQERPPLSSYIERLKAFKRADGTYRESDAVQIEVCARQWQLVDRYEEERNKPDYALRCPVHSMAVLEVNPFENMYLNALKAWQRSLQALGLNSDARGYDMKKTTGGMLETLNEQRRQIRAAYTQGDSVGGIA